MSTRVRCADCRRLDEQDWCTHHVEHVPYPNHWRRCDWYAAELPPLPSVRRALRLADLLGYVAELRDTHEGRALRLRHGVPELERFAIYGLAGLTVIPNDPVIIGRASNGNRGKTDRHGLPGTSQPQSNAA